MIRKADISDLNFLVQIDLKDEGITSVTEIQMTNEDLQLHREKIISGRWTFCGDLSIMG
ncbi:MAG: hypothetical protein ACQEXX_12775 [Bacillota bacterium]